MAKKLVAFTVNNPSSRISDNNPAGVDQLIFDGEEFTSPRAYPEDWRVCPPMPAVSPVLAATELYGPDVEAKPGIVLLEDRVSVHTHLLASSTEQLFRQSFSQQAALAPGQVPPNVRFATRFKVSQEAPGAGGDAGLVQFGISNSSATIGLEIFRDTDGALKSRSYLNGPTFPSTQDLLVVSLNPSNWYEVHLTLELRDDSGTPAGVLKRKVLTYTSEVEPPTTVAVFSDILLTLEQYTDIARDLHDLTHLYLIVKDDSIGWSVDLKELYL